MTSSPSPEPPLDGKPTFDSAASEEEDALVKKLEQRLADSREPWLLTASRGTLIRFLRKASNSCDDAEALLLATAEWRRSYGADSILRVWPVSSSESRLIRCYWPSAICGSAHDGTPVQYTNFSMIDFAYLSQHDLMSVAVRHNVYVLEQATQLQTDGFGYMIFNCSCSPADKPYAPLNDHYWVVGAGSFLKAMAAVFGVHYPLHARRVFVVNCQRFFVRAWDSVLKWLLPADVREAVSLHVGVPLHDLLRVAPMEALPTSIGGAFTGWMPSGGYLTPSLSCSRLLPAFELKSPKQQRLQQEGSASPASMWQRTQRNSHDAQPIVADPPARGPASTAPPASITPAETGALGSPRLI